MLVFNNIPPYVFTEISQTYEIDCFVSYLRRLAADVSLRSMEHVNVACQEWTSCKRRCGFQRCSIRAWQWQSRKKPVRKETRWQGNQYFLSFFQVWHTTYISPSANQEQAITCYWGNFAVKVGLWRSFSFLTAGHCLLQQTAPNLSWTEIYGEIACAFTLDINTAQPWTAGLTSLSIWLQVMSVVWYGSWSRLHILSWEISNVTVQYICN